MNEYLRQITRLLKINGDSMEGMMVVNRDGIIEYYKASSALEKLPDDFGRQVRGKHLLEVYPDLSEETSTVIRTLRTGTITVGEKQVLTSGNFKLTMTTTTYPIMGEDGSIQGAVDIAQLLDISERGTSRPVQYGQSALDDIVTQNAAMEQLKRVVKEVAKNDSATLIYGETGTGKELFAQALHLLSARKDKPFIAQNCAAIPVNLLESMFFGTERGGFTGAESKKGLFELADGGTLFLDEIGDMPAELQTRLLRVLSDGYYYRVGGHQSLKANVRIIAATHQNLEAMVRENRFREDLYHRLNVIRLRLPPLRERPEDIPLLVNHFLQKSAENLGVEPKLMSEEAMEFLKRFPFPGNVRQLENLCNWLVVMAPSQHIRVTDLPEEVRNGEAEKVHKNGEVSGSTPAGGSWEELLKGEVKEMLKNQSPDLMKQLADTFESIVIGTALEYTHGRRVDAATRLGIGRNTITRKIAELKLESED